MSARGPVRSARHRADPARQARPRVPVRAVLAAAARAGRREPWRVLAVAVPLTLCTAAAEIFIDHYVKPTSLLPSLAGTISTTGLSLLATVFISGVLCRIVGEVEHGQEHLTIRQIAKSLPWGRLALADLLVVALVVVGLLALVIPGLIVGNLLAVTGPVIEIEHRPVRAALRRSAGLVRPHFWSVALLVTLPVLVASGIETVVPEPHGVAEILEALAVRGLAEGLIEAVIGLILVELCYRLIALAALRGERSDPTRR
jgi:hypothetical protein